MGRIKELVILDVGETICWKRDGYSYTGIIVDIGDDDLSYYVEYLLAPSTKSWTNVSVNDIDLIRQKQIHDRWKMK